MQRSPELEAMLADDKIDVRDKRARRKQLLGGTALLLGGAALAYVVVFAPEQHRPESVRGDEEFSTTTFRPPSFLREGEKQPEKKPEPIIKLPDPPVAEKKEEPSDTTEFEVPAPPGIAETIDETASQPEKIEEFPKRFLSKQVLIDSSKGENGPDTLGASSTEGGPVVAGEDRNSKFLASASAIGDRSAKARQIERIDAIISEGTLIPGILETAINSDLPGQIRAITSQDVYSFDGRRLLIPAGTRLIGEYQSELTRGQKRIFVIWTRLQRDDGVTVRLNSIGTDSLGRSGLTGIVDNKWRERFGSAILLSIVGAGSSYLTGYGGGSYSSSGNNDSDSDRAAELARETIAQTFSDMANQALAETLEIPPTISVHQGERIFVYVRQDLDFSAIYPDPVVEALKEIKHERGIRQNQSR
ncbi:type IV secretion system protein VirB10 [Phyllobacterium endophyticum]|uniref:Conjugal transfer protein TrbI n=1 Tax=Phyllobacterium endophyticum TaxID=1149773 RepID=A0A2P7AQP8_9HYPH|nr:type IV secretion system protein VirB10 [Phyllobacterium endophyticum]MBB3236991.1 type IV secretion system protein VirB10 [Phyllobacterium endophyticum]PSH56564.1 conjugal transfer protein TrbI [Phyllobacterium endophyticum]TYR44435.1 TrbI/VirB10 family protein [Phyllobacterium endophyticum]